MQLHGLHHLTAVSANAVANHDFYTRVLGLRLVKKTVNQDDTSAYHLFYADGEASPGSDITFFEWPMERERRGTRSIIRTGLRVAGESTLHAWAERLEGHGVAAAPVRELDGRLTLKFEDPEGQRLALIDDGGAGPAHPWGKSTVPTQQQIRGLGPVSMSVPDLRRTEAFVTEVMGMRRGRSYEVTGPQPAQVQVYEMGEGGPAAELHVHAEPQLPQHRPGAGSVHHVAFRVRDNEYGFWVDRFRQLGLRSSGPVDRYYFRSLYIREPGGILFEIATDGPGFDADEPKEHLGERLALPPFLEPQRDAIEKGLKPI